MSRKISKIGLDLDEVLADFMTAFISNYNVRFNANLKKEEFLYFDLTKNIKATKEELFILFQEFYLT